MWKASIMVKRRVSAKKRSIRRRNAASIARFRKSLKAIVRKANKKRRSRRRRRR